MLSLFTILIPTPLCSWSAPLFFSSFKSLTIFCNSTTLFVSDLIRNPKDQFCVTGFKLISQENLLIGVSSREDANRLFNDRTNHKIANKIIKGMSWQQPKINSWSDWMCWLMCTSTVGERMSKFSHDLA